MRLTREVGQVIRLEGWNLLIFEMFFRGATVPLYLWLLNKNIKFTLRMAGYSFLTTENIGHYLIKPWTLFSICMLALIAAIVMMIELGSLISAFQGAAYYRRLGVLEMLAGGIKKTADEIRKGNWKLFGLVLIQGFLGNLLFLYRILIRIRPAKFILDEFFSSWTGRSVFAAMVFLLAMIVLPGIFTFHGCMVEQKHFIDSYRRSCYLIMGRWRKTLFPLAGYYLGVTGLFVAAYTIFLFSLALVAVNLAGEALSWPILLEIRDRVELLWLFFARIGATLVYCGAATVEYYQQTSQMVRKERWDFEYPTEKLLEKRKVFFAVVGITAVNLLLSYDVYHNGMGVAEEVMGEIPITAHRGSSREAPENTMAALQKAVSDMAEFAEIDVQMTKDGVIVLSHDTTLKRTAGVNWRINSRNFDELETLDVGKWFSREFEGEKIPTLWEIMEYAKGKIRLNIELKNEGKGSTLPEEAVVLIEEYDMTEQCVISSVSLDYLRRVKERAPDIITGYVVSAAYGDYYSDEAVDFISIRSSLVDKRLMERVHERGKGVHVWTVNSQNEMERMKLLQVDNIITDLPVKAREVIYGDVESKSVSDCMKLLLK